VDSDTGKVYEQASFNPVLGFLSVSTSAHDVDIEALE